MKKLLPFLALSLGMSYISNAQCQENSSTKVLLVGDSWAFFMGVDQTLNNVFTKWGHSNHKFYTNLTLAQNGARTTHFQNQEKHDEIAARFAEFPDANIVHLSLGGNDMLGDWKSHFTDQQSDSIMQVVKAQMIDVIETIKAIKPGVKIVFSGYVYPNFQEVIQSPGLMSGTSHPFYSNWQKMNYPTNAQINLRLNQFMDTVKAYVDSDPQLEFFPATGLMQYTHGQTTALGVAPGGTYPAYSVSLPYGDTLYPSPKNSMRDYLLTKDCFHLSAGGYFDMIEYQTRLFYHKYLMDDAYLLAESNDRSGSVSSSGTVSADLKVGESGGERFSTVLSFNTAALADTTIAGADIFLRRESLAGSNPIDGVFTIRVTNGNFGASVNVEAADFTAAGNATGDACRFGSNGGDGHWIRLQLPLNVVSEISTSETTQFVVSANDANGGVVTFSDAINPDFAPVLNIRYGVNPFSISELPKKSSAVIFPNPTHGLIGIDTKGENIESVSVVDLQGKTVFRTENKSNTVDISTLPAGTYIMNISTNVGKSAQRVIKL